MALAHLFTDPAFLIAGVGIVVSAVAGIFGICDGEPKPNGKPRWIFVTLIVIGSLIAITLDGITREAQFNDTQEAAAQRQKLLSSYDVLHRQNSALLHDNQLIRSKADATYSQALTLNRKTTEILSGVQAQSLQTRLIDQETKGVAVQANALEHSAAASLHRLAELQTQIGDTYVFYTMTLPLNDPSIAELKRKEWDMLASQRQAQQQGAHSGRQLYALGLIDPTDLFRALDPLGSSYTLLGGLDLQIEMYKRPFPSDPPFAHQSPARLNPDLVLWTDALSSYFRRDGISPNVAPPVRVGLDYATGDSGPSEIDVSVPLTKMHRSRSGRLNSLADLTDAEILLHFNSSIWLGAPEMHVLGEAKLRVVGVEIDDVFYYFDLRKARHGSGPLGGWYEIRIPKNAKLSDYLPQPR